MPYHIPAQIQFIEEACSALGYGFELLDHHSGYLCAVTHAGCTLTLGAGFINAYPINSATAYTISIDKAYTSLLLQRAGLNVPTGDYFFISDTKSALRNTGKTIDDAIAFANTLGYPVIAKPINGSRGNFVQPVYTDQDLRNHLNRMSASFYAAIIQQKIEGHEYRAFVVDGITQFIYSKKKVPIYPESLEAMRQHIANLNQQRTGVGLNEIDLNSGYIKAYEASFKPGQPVAFDILNISSGQADVAALTTEIPEFVASLGRTIYAAIGLRVFAFDFIAASPYIELITNATILEVNGNPMMESLAKAGRHDIIISVWGTILARSFSNQLHFEK